MTNRSDRDMGTQEIADRIRSPDFEPLVICCLWRLSCLSPTGHAHHIGKGTVLRVREITRRWSDNAVSETPFEILLVPGFGALLFELLAIFTNARNSPKLTEPIAYGR